MVRSYKKKRLAEEQSSDLPSKNLDLEGSERMTAKKIIRDELKEIARSKSIERELDEEREMILAEQCWIKEQTIPGYKCTCFEKDKKDE